MQKLTAQEEETMQVIWKTGEGHIKLFLDAMDSRVPYTTLASTIKKLEKKGYLNSILAGNAHIYKPIVTEEEYKNRFMNGFVKNYFENSYKELVNFFIEKKKLSARELKEIIELIEQKKDIH